MPAVTLPRSAWRQCHLRAQQRRAHVHMCASACVHVHNTYASAHAFVCVCVHVRIFIHACLRVHVHVHVYMCACLFICKCLPRCVHKCVHYVCAIVFAHVSRAPSSRIISAYSCGGRVRGTAALMQQREGCTGGATPGAPAAGAARASRKWGGQAACTNLPLPPIVRAPACMRQHTYRAQPRRHRCRCW